MFKESTQTIKIDGPFFVGEERDYEYYSKHPQLGPLLKEGWKVETVILSIARGTEVKMVKIQTGEKSD